MTLRQSQVRELVRAQRRQILARQVESQQIRFQQVSVSRPTYNENGTITRAGGTPERSPALLGNVAVRAGNKVPTQNGEVLGQARADTGKLNADIRTVQSQLIKATSTIPRRTFTGDPNAQTPDLLPQFENEVVRATDTGTDFIWDTGSGQWEPERQVLHLASGPPSQTIWVDGAIAAVSPNEIWVGELGNGWTQVSGGGGLTILEGNDPPQPSDGTPGSYYLDKGVDPSNLDRPGEQEVLLYWKGFYVENDVTVAEWERIDRRAVLGVPTVNGTRNGQMHTTRGGMTYTWWEGVWRRPNRHTHGPNPPDLKQIGDTHTVPTDVNGDLVLCVYEYDGMMWDLQGCCDDCGPAPPEEPDPDDYPISCTGGVFFPDTGKFFPNRPFPDFFGGFVCTIFDPDEQS
ncbi:MAG: hypothetical protein AAF810_04965 [Cyanobacteria bacterium P01_D01_bin.36]